MKICKKDNISVEKLRSACTHFTHDMLDMLLRSRPVAMKRTIGGVDPHAHRLEILSLVGDLERNLNIIRREDDFKREFEAMFPRIDEEIVLHKGLLAEKHPVVVVGETSSGKSSFLNLMLKEPLLPVDHQHATEGIIKVQKSQRLAVIPKGKDPITPNDNEILKKAGKAAKFVRETLTKLVVKDEAEVDESGNRMHSEIDVHWPFQNSILEDDMTIVDTPGYGETEAMKTLLMGYLHKAAGCLYVVNAGNAGGIQSDRLQQIIKDQQDYCDKHKVQLMDPKRALFFFNKWDQIQVHGEYDDYDDDDDDDSSTSGKEDSPPVSVQESVWNNNIKKLQSSWTEFQGEQAMKFSVTQARGKVEPCLGVQHNQEEMARRKIVQVVENSLEHGLDPTKRWLKTISTFISTTLDKHLKTGRATKEEKEMTMTLFLEMKAEIEKSVEEQKQKIKRKIKQEVGKLACSVDFHVKSEGVRDEMKNWSYSDFPNDCSIISSSSEEIKHKTGRIVIDRLAAIIRRDMEKEMRKFPTFLTEFIRLETAEIISMLQQLDTIFLKDLQQQNVQTTDAKQRYRVNFTLFDLWTGSLQNLVSLQMLQGFFVSENFFVTVFLKVPFLFMSNLITMGRFSTPHAVILRKTSEEVIDAINIDKVQDAIMTTLDILQQRVDDFFLDILPRNLNSLEQQFENVCKSTEEAKKTIGRYTKLQADLETFLASCDKILI